jgi:putative phosphoribosyl transferase
MSPTTDAPRGYADRFEAGRELGQHLDNYARRSDVVVLGLARGGVAVAAEVARSLGVPLDVLVVRKLGRPANRELAMGAIAANDDTTEVFLDKSPLADSAERPDVFDEVYRRELVQLRHRQEIYRQHRRPEDVRDRVVILVDDGLATGSTMRAAIAAVRRLAARKVVVAVPVAQADICDRLRAQVDELHCLWTPRPFIAVGQAYEDFRSLTDDEVGRLLAAGPRSSTKS